MIIGNVQVLVSYTHGVFSCKYSLLDTTGHRTLQINIHGLPGR